MLINSEMVKDSTRLFFYDIDSFSRVFGEKPVRSYDKNENVYKFCFLNYGCSVSHGSKTKTKKSFPIEITFYFNSFSQYVPCKKLVAFHDSFSFDKIIIDQNTTFSQFKALGDKYRIKNNTVEFYRGYLIFDDSKPESKINCIKVRF